MPSVKLAIMNPSKQAVTKAYSLHDLRLVGISNKSEFNTAEMAHSVTPNEDTSLSDLHVLLFLKFSANQIAD